MQWLKQSLLLLQFGIADAPNVPDHCSCESKPGEVSLPEKMHFTEGVLLLFAGFWATLEAARNEDFRKAGALALKPKKCSSVITSCAVVYESADCAGGWHLPINEVPLLLLSLHQPCVLFRKKGGSGFGAVTTSTGFVNSF